jgi:uncharacterized protein YbaA (DUF1428 family)
MKMKSLMTMSILAAALQTAPITFGQDANEAGKGGSRHHEERFANLSADEREKLKAAREKAMQDPGVQAAHEKRRQADKEFRDALHASMLKADPSIQPILDKMPKGERHEH